MKVDVDQSIYWETPEARQDFSRSELRRCRYLLRRLRFLEAQVRETGGMEENGGSAHAEWEVEALEWILLEVGYLSDRRPVAVNQ